MFYVVEGDCCGGDVEEVEEFGNIECGVDW